MTSWKGKKYELFYGLGDIVFKRKIRKAVRSVKMSQNWKDKGGPRQAKDLLGDFDHGRSKTCRSLCKKSLRFLTGFITGHCRPTFKGHLHKRLTSQPYIIIFFWPLYVVGQMLMFDFLSLSFESRSEFLKGFPCHKRIQIFVTTNCWDIKIFFTILINLCTPNENII